MFMERVLKDPALKQYRGKFPTKPKEIISRNYMCHTRLQKVDTDSTVMEGDGIIDENAVPVEGNEDIPKPVQ